MLVCPKCRTSYSASATGTCFRDGTALVDHAAFVAAESDPLRGRVIRGEYTIGPRIGQGGMGTVYRARHASLRRDVAIKILRPEHAADGDTVARFQREAAALSLLAHPNTVRVYDFGQTDDGLFYLVMELLEGEPMTQVLARQGALSLIDAIRVAQQILRSLSEAHAQGVVHRDLKPDNIFIARVPGHATPVIKVLDFGIAKLMTGDVKLDAFETQAGTVFGTPRFMSPEQAQGGGLDNRSDLYSVGAMLYQMLTGRAPFIDEDAVVVMAKHIREMPPTPSSVAPERGVPPLLEAVVMRALAKEPASRFQHASEFDAALESCVAETTGLRGAVEARPTSGIFSARNSRFVLLTCIVGAGLALVAYAARREYHNIAQKAALSAAPATEIAVPRAAPLPSTASLTPEVSSAGALPTGEVTPEPEHDAAAEPAVVAIRSEPSGATVVRDGVALGATPISLVVAPTEPYVRIELRAEGRESMMAELTAKDGERVFVLKESPKPDARATPGPRRKPGHARKPSRHRPVAAPNAVPGPASAPDDKQKSPYQRFE
jgi:serine/threonine-protein kinase